MKTSSNSRRLKAILIVIGFLGVMFFSNDFGLIDVEKEAIITAVAIDKSQDEDYSVTVQIAVPEATNTTTENNKTQINGEGKTIGEAIKNTGDVSGWFPQLAFCNLIIIGKEVATSNIITVLDFFAKTLRIQDSAQIVLAEKTAKELLEKTTPLDNISSFAIQKILFKNPGFDTDVATNDIKTFCAGYYAPQSSSFMPIIKVLDAQKESQNQGQNDSQGQGGGQSSSNSQKGKNFFDAGSTALFHKGVMVGELNKDLTHAFNMLWRKVKGSTIPVDFEKDGKQEKYLLKVLRCTPKVKLNATEQNLTINIDVSLYFKITDHSADDHDASISNNKPLPHDLKLATENMLKNHLTQLVELSKQTGCDFLGVGDKLYRFCHKYYGQYKENFLQVVQPIISVRVTGQK